MRRYRPLGFILFIIWCFALFFTPIWADNYLVRIAITMAMFSAMALSWNFIGGFVGYPSFSTAAFFGIGCYLGALAQRADVPMIAGWLLATIVVSAFAAVLGAACCDEHSRIYSSALRVRSQLVLQIFSVRLRWSQLPRHTVTYRFNFLPMI